METQATHMTFLLWVLSGANSSTLDQGWVARGGGFNPSTSCSQKWDHSPHTIAGTASRKYQRQVGPATAAHASWQVCTSKSSEKGMSELQCTYEHAPTAGVTPPFPVPGAYKAGAAFFAG